MRIRDFLLLTYDKLPGRLSKAYRRHQWRIRWSLLQVYFETAAIHYEVWVQKRSRRIELGLHFECDAEESYAWAAALAPRALEIQAELGSSVELEEWTPAWTRLHETITFAGELSEGLADDVAARLARYIEVLEPLRKEEKPLTRSIQRLGGRAAGAGASTRARARPSAGSRRA